MNLMLTQFLFPHNCNYKQHCCLSNKGVFIFPPHTQTHMHGRLTFGPSASAYLSILICIYSRNRTELRLVARRKSTEWTIWREGQPHSALLWVPQITSASSNITSCQQKNCCHGDVNRHACDAQTSDVIRNKVKSTFSCGQLYCAKTKESFCNG